jgi:hypothetical protein
LVVHIDNAATQNAKLTQNFFENSPLKRSPQPPGSPDISPSDFYRFRKVKNALIRQEIPDEIGLPEIVTGIVDGISGDELFTGHPRVAFKGDLMENPTTEFAGLARGYPGFHQYQSM